MLEKKANPHSTSFVTGVFLLMQLLQFMPHWLLPHLPPSAPLVTAIYLKLSPPGYQTMFKSPQKVSVHSEFRQRSITSSKNKQHARLVPSDLNSELYFIPALVDL
jgi:hypothetical protein